MKPIPTLHLLGIPHTLSFDERYSHCAFTTKVNRFVHMMAYAGYPVIHYGNIADGFPATLYAKKGQTFENVRIFSERELEEHTGAFDPASQNFIGHHAAVDSRLYRNFNARLSFSLNQYVQPSDIICCPFGTAHLDGIQASAAARGAFVVETGIGYEETFAQFRIFESAAWMHYHYGKKKERLNDNRGSDYDFVIPNYFDVSEWDLNTKPGEYVLYFGRVGEYKGMAIVQEIAKRRPDLKFVICGQGDATPWLTPNMEVRPPVVGQARSGLLGKAIAVLMPSRYVEPFGGVAVEAMLCGRPVLASVFGAFSETLGIGCRQCRTLADWMSGLKWCEGTTPMWHHNIRHHAERKFDMFKLARKYDAAFRQISDLTRGGWYANVDA